MVRLVKPYEYFIFRFGQNKDKNYIFPNLQFNIPINK
jgi:hypothetical protein